MGLASWAQLALKDGGEYSYYFGWPCTITENHGSYSQKEEDTGKLKDSRRIGHSVQLGHACVSLGTLPPTLSILHPRETTSKPHPVQDLERSRYSTIAGLAADLCEPVTSWHTECNGLGAGQLQRHPPSNSLPNSWANLFCFPLVFLYLRVYSDISYSISDMHHSSFIVTSWLEFYQLKNFFSNVPLV